MKKFMLFIVVLFFVPLVLSGQISNQTVGGWKIVETQGSIVKAGARVVKDTVYHGNYSTSFSQEASTDTASITYEKIYSASFQKLSRIGGGINVYTKKMDIKGIVYAFISFGNNLGYSDPVGALMIFGSDKGYFYTFFFPLERVPAQSDRIKIKFVSRKTNSFEIFIDYLYFGPTNVDLELVVDDFEDTTVPVRDELTIPNSLKIFQNYPNPFNASTVINYQLSVTSNVKIIVYDVLGREVAVLVNEEKLPGSYEVIFSASNLASGTYFFVLRAGNFSETKKMLLIK